MDLKIVDLDAALARMGGNTELLEMMIGLVADDLPNVLTGLRKAIADDDREALAHHAHNVRGLAASVGAQRIRTPSVQLEQSAEGEDGIELAPLADKLIEAIDELQQFLADRR
jgi:HPt (histidine-containing phosphotransfer) domain-containing protein